MTSDTVNLLEMYIPTPQIISHNSVNIHRIPTKVGTEIRLNKPFKCAKFQPDLNMHSCCMADFAKCME